MTLHLQLPALGRLSEIANQSPSDFGGKTRVARACEFIRHATDTLEKKIPTSQVCLSWSKFADAALAAGFAETMRLCPIETPLALFGYGKLGAQELNLSSDVDLVLVAASEDPQLSEWVRTFSRLIQDNTEFGFCFRLDFDLRPGGRLGPMVPTVMQFEDYFLNYGEAWERLAFTRFRGICGHSDILERCLHLSRSFTYRKHLDFTLLEDLKVLRQRIHEQNWRRSENGALDLKLGLGGIRDLELFVHTQQVIHGGRDIKLRVGATEIALRLLCERKILTDQDVDFLVGHYWKLRHYENLLQAATDRQIQVLPAGEWLELITENERISLQEDMLRCQDFVSDLLGPVDVSKQSLPETEAEQFAWLSELGYSTAIQERVWFQLLQKNALSRAPERDELFRKRFLFLMTEKLASQAQNRDLSLEILQDFLKSIRAKATFFHLLLQNPELIDRLALLFSSSPYLSRTLIERPELLDSFLYQAHEPEQEGEWDQFLSHWLEKKLLSEMSAGLAFLESRDLIALMSRLTSVADDIVMAVLARLRKEHASSLRVIAMGKWGGEELGLHSDLDLVFYTETVPTEADFRVARRLISRLTELQKGGSLYQLDFRLKPHGKGGPLLTSWPDLLTYLQTEAQAWERQAYLKARVLGSPEKNESVRKACLARPFTSEEWRELEQIHQGLLGKSKNEWDLKYSAGGMVETEFIVQLICLQNGKVPPSSSTICELRELAAHSKEWHAINKNYLCMRTWEQMLRLISTRPQIFLNENSDEISGLSALTQQSPTQLLRRIQTLLEDNAALIAPLDPRTRQG